MLIPKIAHQIWFQDKNKINKEPYQTCHKTCLTKLKLFNWKHIIWDDKSIRKLITTYYPQYLSLYNYFDIMVQKIDLAKYIIIYHYGGVYIDMDMDCVKDLTNLINPIDELIFSKVYALNILSSGVFLSKPKHPFWLELLSIIDKYKNKNKIFYLLNSIYVLSTTGNFILHYTLHKTKNKYRVLDRKYLEPCEDHSHCDNIQDAYLIGRYGNHWTDSIDNIVIYIFTYRKIFCCLILFIIITYYLIKKLKHK